MEVGSGTSYYIPSFLNHTNVNELCCDAFFNTQTRGVIKVEDNLDLFILQSYADSDLDDLGVGSIRCFAEYHKYSSETNEKMVSIRCHPNYRGKGYCWNDWALIRYVYDDGDVKDFPSRVVCCCIPRHNIIDGVETTTFDLVVQCCGEPTGRESFLFTEWTFNKTFHVVSSEAVVQLCFVPLESTTPDSDVLIVSEKEKWVSLFYELAMVDHTIHHHQ